MESSARTRRERIRRQTVADINVTYLGIVDHLRRRFARFKLGAYFLQARSKHLR
jgi:hypothetical protein